MQARLAIEPGKQLFLLCSLVTEREWARKYLKRPRVYEVSDVADILRAREETAAPGTLPGREDTWPETPLAWVQA